MRRAVVQLEVYMTPVDLNTQSNGFLPPAIEGFSESEDVSKREYSPRLSLMGNTFLRYLPLRCFALTHKGRLENRARLKAPLAFS